MDENTTKIIVACVELAKALIWPVALTALILVFRRQIGDFMATCVSLSIGKDGIALQRLQAELQRTNIVVEELAKNPASPEASDLARSLMKPDGNLVAAWATAHRADNPWDLGPKNWERCLYDLGHPGGKNHTLEWENGKLKYQ